MIQLINERTQAFVVRVPALPAPTDLSFKRAFRRFWKLHGDSDAFDDALEQWLQDKRQPNATRVPELRWIKSRAPNAELTCDGVVGEQVIYVVTFRDKSLATMFKLTFGGALSETLAFAA